MHADIALSSTTLGGELGWWYEIYYDFYDSCEVNYEHYDNHDNYEIVSIFLRYYTWKSVHCEMWKLIRRYKVNATKTVAV